MTRAERKAFREGYEEGFVRAAELSGNQGKVLRQFRPVNPEFQRRKTAVTGRRPRARRKMNAV